MLLFFYHYYHRHRCYSTNAMRRCMLVFFFLNTHTHVHDAHRYAYDYENNNNNKRLHVQRTRRPRCNYMVFKIRLEATTTTTAKSRPWRSDGQRRSSSGRGEGAGSFLTAAHMTALHSSVLVRYKRSDVFCSCQSAGRGHRRRWPRLGEHPRPTGKLRRRRRPGERTTDLECVYNVRGRSPHVIAAAVVVRSPKHNIRRTRNQE